MIPFQYHRATSVEDAVSTVAEHPDATFLAGGTNLVDHMKLGIAEPSLLVDIGHLFPLQDIEVHDDGALRIGADVRNADLAAHPVVRASYHLYQGIGPALGNAVMGIVFGYWYQRTGRVVPLVVAHAVLDIVAFVGYALFKDALNLP